MKRKYDVATIARNQGFNIKDSEKVLRISDLLEDISAVKFLSDRLSLYGGTALTFIYLPRILRLSIDLDFNYRHIDTMDWGDVRQEIDAKLKELIYRQKYSKNDIAINASYPLTRFTIKYLNSMGLEDSVKIEIGYLRRIPILRTDSLADFKHIGTQETFKTKTPQKEELFANKWCTLLYRKAPRDLFDTYQITRTEFNHEIFHKCAIIDSLTHETPKIHQIDPTFIEKIPIDSSLKNLLQTKNIQKYDFTQIARTVKEFTQTQLTNITTNEKKAVDQFYDHKSFSPQLIDNTGLFHERINEYPAVLRVLQKQKL
jgi:predicted nucleotidyltransferase component of viral defense system